MAGMSSSSGKADQAIRTPEPGKPDASQTIWQVVLDLTNKRDVFESTTRPNIVWVDFNEISFAHGSKVLKLHLVGQMALEGGLAGNVSHKFADVGEDATAVLATGVEALDVVAHTRDDFTAHKNPVQQLVGKTH